MSVKASTGPRSTYSQRTNSGQLLRETAKQNIMSNKSATGFGASSGARLDPKSTAVITMDEL